MLDRIAARITTLATRYRQRGLTTLEYALAGALIAVVVVAAVKLIGTNASSHLSDVGSSVKSN